MYVQKYFEKKNVHSILWKLYSKQGKSLFSQSMQKSLFKIIFGRKVFICEPIFKNFAAHFKTNEVTTKY